MKHMIISIERSSIFIEANPVRAGLVPKADDWVWSSAFARVTGNEVVPDARNIPVEHAL